MQPEQDHVFHFPQNETERRVLLVIGKMGQGKSSFIRSLVTPQGTTQLMTANVPLVKGGQKSTTLQPELFAVHKQHNLTGDNRSLYVLDTEGLDSQDATSLVLQQIDSFIQKYKLVIVGIAYVIGGRQQGKNGESFLKTFLSILKLKPKFKNRLFFCVHTNWFKSISDCIQEENTQSLRQFLADLQLPQLIFKKTVYWDSGPNNSKGYEKFLKQTQQAQQYKTAFTNQWKQLRFNLSEQVHQMCSVEQYAQHYLQFWNKLKDKVQSQYAKKEEEHKKYSWQKTQFIFYHYISSYRHTKSFTEIFVDSAKSIGREIMNLARNDGIKQLISRKQTAVPVVVGLAVLAGIGFLGTIIIESFSSDQGAYFTGASKQKLDQIIKKRLIERINLIQKSMISQQIISSKRLALDYGKKQLKMLKPIQYIDRIVVYHQTDDRTQNLGDLKADMSIKVSLKNGEKTKLIFRVYSWMLTFESFNKIYMQTIKQVYGDQTA